MAFRFSLQKVLEHRKVLENVAQVEFQEALEQLRIQTKNLNDLQSQRTQAFRTRHLIQTKEVEAVPEKLQQIHIFLQAQDIQIEKQKAKVGDAEKLVEAKREILQQKAIEYKIIEKLKERKREEYLRDQALKEQKELDEISVLRFSSEKET